MTPDDDVAGEDAVPHPDAHAFERVRAELHRLDRILQPGRQLVQGAEEHIVAPAWRRVTQGEPRWPVSVAIATAMALQLVLPRQFALNPRWVLPTLQGLLLAGLFASNPRRMNRESRSLRATSALLIAVMSVANAASAARLVVALVEGNKVVEDPARLLATGAAIWLTNVIVFALWYWDLDRGGPVARAHATREHPDFLYPQMQSPELSPPDWEPGFADYLYLSFTNATAFSPTDVLPLSRWAKLTMMLQSAVSLTTVGLVIARAVNILK